MCMYTYIQTRIHTHVLAYMYMHRKRAVYGRWNKPKNLNWWMKIVLVARLSSYSFLFYTLHLAIKLFIQISIDDRTGLLYTYIWPSSSISRHILYGMNMDFSISVLHFFAYSISCKNNLPLLVFLWKYAKAKCQDNPFWWKVFIAYLKLRWQAAVKTAENTWKLKMRPPPLTLTPSPGHPRQRTMESENVK